ncbi:hypothetical protein SNEBB_006034 [Seison nebaliae]|nr:hypothetical protein SNEBB_006034 [Seison nebaliae]
MAQKSDNDEPQQTTNSFTSKVYLLSYATPRYVEDHWKTLANMKTDYRYIMQHVGGATKQMLSKSELASYDENRLLKKSFMNRMKFLFEPRRKKSQLLPISTERNYSMEILKPTSQIEMYLNIVGLSLIDSLAAYPSADVIIGTYIYSYYTNCRKQYEETKPNNYITSIHEPNTELDSENSSQTDEIKLPSELLEYEANSYNSEYTTSDTSSQSDDFFPDHTDDATLDVRTLPSYYEKQRTNKFIRTNFDYNKFYRISDLENSNLSIFIVSAHYYSFTN